MFYHENHRRLVLAMMTQEALNYLPNRKSFNKLEMVLEQNTQNNLKINKRGKEWVANVLLAIDEEYKEHFPEGSDRIVIESLSNCGLVDCSIIVEPAKFNWKKGQCTITLCNCGKVSCWGSMTRGEKRL